MNLPHSPTFLPYHQDWHPADIIATLRKKGTSLAAVSRAAGLSSSTLANALTRPWAKGELLISKAIGVPAESIWPSRYFDAKTCERVARPLRAHRMKRREDISRV